MLFLIFILYLLAFAFLILILSLNYVRIGFKTGINPKAFTLLLPMIINFLMAHTTFRKINPLYTTLLPCIFCYFMAKRLERVRIFGITGGMGTGKNTLLRLIRRNLPLLQVIDGDQIMKELNYKGKSGYNFILKLLGDKKNEFLTQRTQELDKKKIYVLMVQDEKFTKQVNDKLVSMMSWTVLKTILSNIFHKKNLILVSSKRFCQSKLLKFLCFPILQIKCSRNVQIDRAGKKHGYEQDVTIKLIQSEIYLEGKCHISIQNCYSEEILLNQFLTEIKPYMQKNVGGSKYK